MSGVCYRGFSLVFVHDDFVMLNKAPGIGMHDEEGILGLVSEARAQLGMTLYPVHRLDKVTSGLLILARNVEANRSLSQAFAERQVTKVYLALSQHKPKKKQGWIKGDMARGRRGTWLLTRSQLNPAITWFESEGLGEGVRLFTVHPKTGKTHQIRVALKSLGAPILGDELYGAASSDRVYLHSFRVGFTYQGTSWTFTSLPEQGELYADERVQAALCRVCEPAAAS